MKILLDKISNSQIKRSRYYLEHSLQLFLSNTFTPHCYPILGGKVTRAVINEMTLHFIIENFRNVENSKTQMLCNDNKHKQLWMRHKLLWNIKRHLLIYHFQHGRHALQMRSNIPMLLSYCSAVSLVTISFFFFFERKPCYLICMRQ